MTQNKEARANNDDLLIGLLRREGWHSGVWFADKLLEAADRLEAFSRSKPDGGGEANLEASARMALMYLETGFVECGQCGNEVETKDLDATYELQSALSPAQQGSGGQSDD